FRRVLFRSGFLLRVKQPVGHPSGQAVHQHHVMGGSRLQPLRQAQRFLQHVPPGGTSPAVLLDAPLHLLIAGNAGGDDQHPPAEGAGQGFGKPAFPGTNSSCNQAKAHPSPPPPHSAHTFRRAAIKRSFSLLVRTAMRTYRSSRPGKVEASRIRIPRRPIRSCIRPEAPRPLAARSRSSRKLVSLGNTSTAPTCRSHPASSSRSALPQRSARRRYSSSSRAASPATCAKALTLQGILWSNSRSIQSFLPTA